MTKWDAWFSRGVGVVTLLSILVPLVLPFFTAFPLLWGLGTVAVSMALLNVGLLVRHGHCRGVLRVCRERDSTVRGRKSFDVLERWSQFHPRRRVILIGFSVAYVSAHLLKQLEALFGGASELVIEVVLLEPLSAPARMRSQELFKNDTELGQTIIESLERWKRMRERFPERIVLKTTTSVLYTEYEASDVGEPGYIYCVPIGYRRHANVTPGLLLEPHSALYAFHQGVVEQILRDAVRVA